MVIQEWPVRITFDNLDFTISPFWIQVYGIPPNRMTRANAQKIRGLFHGLCEINFAQGNAIRWRDFFI